MISRLRSAANIGHGLAWTVFMSSVGLASYAFTGNRGLFRDMTRFWARGLAAFWGMRVKVEQRSGIDLNSPYIVMANHMSHVDIVALFMGLPMHVGFLAKEELRKTPFLGAAMVAGGHIFVERGNRREAMRAMDEAARRIREGSTVVVFPEGTRGRSEQVQGFKRGGFFLARKAGVPILPVGLRGTRTIMDRDSLRIHPGAVHVHIGEPIEPGDFSDVSSLVAETRARIAELSAMPLRPTE